MTRWQPRAPWQLLLLLVMAHQLEPSAGTGWPWPQKPKEDISSAARCREASGGHVYKGDSIYPPLQSFFKINGPVLQLPTSATDITTAATLIQLAVPQLRLVLDPLLFLQATPPKAAGGGGGIPRLIHMTTRRKHALAPHQILSMVSWGWHNRGYALLLYDDADIGAYMRRFYPGFMPTYKALKSPVEKSDAWRYHVLCGHGGVYADTDTIAAAPFASWADFNATPEPGLIVGIENRFHSQAEAEEASYVARVQVTQWTMAAKKAHPVVCRMGGAIKAFVDDEAASATPAEETHGADAAILLRTGPGIWSKEVSAYLGQMGSSIDEVAAAGGQVTDVVVLPQAAFGCNFRYWAPSNNASLVYHMFNNSWKVDHYRVADTKRAARLAAQARAAAQHNASQAVVRLLYPLLVVLTAAFVVALALYAGLCWCMPGQGASELAGLVGWGPAGLIGRRRRRPHALVAGSSPRASPVGSPRSSGSSPRKNAAAGGRSVQQRQAAQAHLQGGGTRKSARLAD